MVPTYKSVHSLVLLGARSVRGCWGFRPYFPTLSCQPFPLDPCVGCPQSQLELDGLICFSSLGILVALLHPHKLHNLPILICWGIWIAQNRSIFHDHHSSWSVISAHITTFYHLIPYDPNHPPPWSVHLETIYKYFPWAYFAGSAQHIGCGGGEILYLLDQHFYKLSIAICMVVIILGLSMACALYKMFIYF